MLTQSASSTLSVYRQAGSRLSTARVWATCPTQCRRLLATAGLQHTPKPFNESNLHYAPSSPELEKLIAALEDMRAKIPLRVPSVRDGEDQVTQSNESASETYLPSEASTVFAQYKPATEVDVSAAIKAALKAKKSWQDTPFYDRAAVFLRAAELVSEKYRFELRAATMLGQGKNAWQAEIDAAAELADFYRYNMTFAEEIYSRQPTVNERRQAGRTDWRPLEGFVYAISPFNFTAIGGNLISGPALLGNVVLWKPSASNIYASYLVYKILREAGLPPNVIQFTNDEAEMVTKVALDHTELSAIDFTGSSSVFRSLFSKIADGVREKKYRDFPRLVAETSGKNSHLVHKSADISNAVNIRSAPPSKQFVSEMKHELASVKVGPPEDFGSFTGPVINQAEFDKITKAIDASNKDSQLELVTGGKYDSSEGLYIEPTLYVAKNADHPLFDRGLFGPVLVAYVYPDAEFDWVLEKIDQKGGGFALTGAIFANDTMAIRKAENRLRYAAGNFYTNCKTNGAVIGQQSFGGARGSGTNDKAGSANMLMRFTAPRTLKEEYNTLDNVLYPSNA